MIRKLDYVVLECDLPEHGLARRDGGTVVLVHEGGGYEVEFTALDSESVAVLALANGQVLGVRTGEIAHARGLARAT